MATLQLQPGPMQGILKGLVEGLVQASSGQQLSRAYLYGSLLYYLQLTNEQTLDHLAGTHRVYRSVVCACQGDGLFCINMTAMQLIHIVNYYMLCLYITL